MTRALAAAAAALLVASCYDPGGQCTADTDCLASQVCGSDKLCVAGTRPPPGTAPTAVPDPSYTTPKDVPLNVAKPGVLANDADPAGGGLTATLATNAAYGQVFLAADGSFVYAPLLGFVGTDTFTYRAVDGELVSDPATVTITVGP